jgi:hypothetical protein
MPALYHYLFDPWWFSRSYRSVRTVIPALLLLNGPPLTPHSGPSHWFPVTPLTVPLPAVTRILGPFVERYLILLSYLLSG